MVKSSPTAPSQFELMFNRLFESIFFFLGFAFVLSTVQSDWYQIITGILSDIVTGVESDPDVACLVMQASN